MQGLSHLGEAFRRAPGTRSMIYRRRSDDPVSAPENPRSPAAVRIARYGALALVSWSRARLGCPFDRFDYRRSLPTVIRLNLNLVTFFRAKDGSTQRRRFREVALC